GLERPSTAGTTGQQGGAGRLRGLRGQRAGACLLRHAGRDFQPDPGRLPPGGEAHGASHTRADRGEGHRLARGGGPQAQLRGLQRRGYEPHSRPVYRASGEGEPQERRREAPRHGPAQVHRRATELPFLPRDVALLLFHLWARARAARDAPDRHRPRRRHRLRPPPPNLQSPHEEGV
ncbi:MAG: hypothetical protein AVDCRST_MAG78-614, partial [uncultured Rubrobacteraceae bacterium]